MNIIIKYRSISHYVYFWLLTLLAVSMPFSSFLISLSQILLILNWAISGNWDGKVAKIKQHKSLFIFLLLFLIHLMWLPMAKDIYFGLEDIKIKLPLLVLPLIIASTEALEPEKVRLLLRFFIGSVVAATFFSFSVYYGFTSYKVTDVRDISVFISHTRLSLLIIICILTILHWIKTEGRTVSKHHILYIFIIIWLIFFLFLLKSLTGVVILSVTTFVLIFIFLNTIENQFLKVGLIIIMYAIPFFSGISILNAYNTFYDEKDGDLAKLERFTINNRPYLNDTISYQRENGHRVWIYVCEEELEKEWNKRSKLKYSGTDTKNQSVRSSLIRYLTSKGLRKDSVGIWQLSYRDIVNINDGMANFIYEQHWSIYPRVYEVIWELHNYANTGFPNKHSLVQRFANSEIAVSYIKNNLLLGVGSSNISLSYSCYYKENGTDISSERPQYTQNQYLRFFMAFGLIGFIIFLVAFFLPPFMEKRWPSYYFLMIFLIIFLSFLTEDTLETGVGVTFVAFFYSLFLWGSHRRLL